MSSRHLPQFTVLIWKLQVKNKESLSARIKNAEVGEKLYFPLAQIADRQVHTLALRTPSLKIKTRQIVAIPNNPKETDTVIRLLEVPIIEGAVPVVRKERKKKYDPEKMVKLHKNGLSQTEIMKVLGCSRPPVADAIRNAQ